MSRHSLCSGALCPGLFPDYGHAMAGHMQILALPMLTQLQRLGQTAKGPQQQLNVCSSLCSQLPGIAQHHRAIVHPNHPAGPLSKRLNGVPCGSTPVLAFTDMQSGRCLAAHGLCATFVLIAFSACSEQLMPMQSCITYPISRKTSGLLFRPGTLACLSKALKRKVTCTYGPLQCLKARRATRRAWGFFLLNSIWSACP